MEKPSVLIVAAEESSSLYAFRLLEKWKADGIEVSAFGVGNQAMESIGFQRLGAAEDMAVMGLSEVLSHFKVIRSVYYRILEECKKRKPKVAILMDYPGFNLRISKKLKKLGIPIIYYISPQLWAWKAGRIKTIRANVDHMLVLLPFEEEYYRKRNVKATFVGHPLLDEITEDLLSPAEQNLKRLKFGVPAGKKVLGLMPGSRKGEIKYQLQTQLEVAQALTGEDPNLHVQILLAASLKKSDLDLSQVRFPVSVIQLKPLEMIGMCDAILCASGTATLMVGLIEKPLVIMYKVNAFTYWVGRKIVDVPFFGLINLISQKEIAPEKLQQEANTTELVRCLKEILYNREAHDAMVKKLKHLKTLLGSRGATERVSEIVKAYL